MTSSIAYSFLEKDFSGTEPSGPQWLELHLWQGHGNVRPFLLFSSFGPEGQIARLLDAGQPNEDRIYSNVLAAIVCRTQST